MLRFICTAFLLLLFCISVSARDEDSVGVKELRERLKKFDIKLKIDLAGREDRGELIGKLYDIFERDVFKSQKYLKKFSFEIEELANAVSGNLSDDNKKHKKVDLSNLKNTGHKLSKIKLSKRYAFKMSLKSTSFTIGTDKDLIGFEDKFLDFMSFLSAIRLCIFGQFCKFDYDSHMIHVPADVDFEVLNIEELLANIELKKEFEGLLPFFVWTVVKDRIDFAYIDMDNSCNTRYVPKARLLYINYKDIPAYIKSEGVPDYSDANMSRLRAAYFGINY